MSTCSWKNEKVIIFLLRTVHGSLSRASRTDKQGRLREVELWIHIRLMRRLNMWEWCSLVVWWGMLRNTMKVFQSDCYTRECIERASYNTSVTSFVWKDLNSTVSVIKWVKLEIVQDDVKYKQLFQKERTYYPEFTQQPPFWWQLLILLIQMYSESVFSIWVDTVCCIWVLFLSRPHLTVKHTFFCFFCCHYYLKMLGCNCHNATLWCPPPPDFWFWLWKKQGNHIFFHHQSHRHVVCGHQRYHPPNNISKST